MEFKLNTSARETKINELAEKQIKAILNNLNKGERVTEMCMPKEIAGDVREKLDELLKGQPFFWETLRREPNPYTGRMQYFTGITIGDDKHYKLRYNGE